MAGRFEESAGMGRFVMLSLATERLDGLRRVLVWEDLLLSLATERLDGLRGVLVWEVLLCYH